MNINKRDSCREIFKQLNIFPLQSQYIFSILIFISKNRELFRFISEIHGISTRYNSNLHLPSTTLTLFQKGTFYSGSRIFNHLPSNIKDLLYNEKQFKSVLKKYF
jgi:biopolymer transport protein ExbB/TolQ